MPSWVMQFSPLFGSTTIQILVLTAQQKHSTNHTDLALSQQEAFWVLQQCCMVIGSCCYLELWHSSSCKSKVLQNWNKSNFERVSEDKIPIIRTEKSYWQELLKATLKTEGCELQLVICKQIFPESRNDGGNTYPTHFSMMIFWWSWSQIGSHVHKVSPCFSVLQTTKTNQVIFKSIVPDKKWRIGM